MTWIWPSSSKIILVTLATQQCFICDLRKKRNGRVELSDAPIANGTNHDGESKASVKFVIRNYCRIPRPSTDIFFSYRGTITVARFSSDGKTVWAGTSSGALLTFGTRTKEVRHLHPERNSEIDRGTHAFQLISREKLINNYSIKHMEFDRAGKYG